MADPSTMLAIIDAHRSRSRIVLRSVGWQWLVVWSAVSAGAGLSAFTEFAGWYWTVGAPLGMMATAIVSRRADGSVPLRRRSGPYWTVGAALGISSLAMSLMLDDEVIVVVIWVLFGIAFAGLATLERLAPAAWLFGGLAVVSALLGLVVDDTFALYPMLAFSYAGAMAGVAGGVWLRGRQGDAKKGIT